MKKRITITVDHTLKEWLEAFACDFVETIGEIVEELAANWHPLTCGCCKGHLPKMWMVNCDVWKHYIKEPFRDMMICLKCWAKIIKVDTGAFQNKYGPPKIVGSCSSKEMDEHVNGKPE
jgi:hypothetical protein